jgi:HEAT repeat protein
MIETGKGRVGERAKQRSALACVALVLLLIFPVANCFSATTEPPPDPGFEASVQMADAIVDAEIVAGGPFRAVAIARKVIRGDVPTIFELEGYNSYNWDTVHQGFAAGSRFILFLSNTQRPDVFSTLTPAAPRLAVQQDGILLSIGDPPFRVPIKRAAMEEALALLVEAKASGKAPDRAEAFVRTLWEGGDIEPRYLAVFLAGTLRDARTSQLLIDASKDKLLKMRLTAIEALGKVNTPETLAALRSLLKDEKATVSREAARSLTQARDVDSLAELLDWTRKSSDALAKGGAGGAKADPNKAKTEAAAVDALKFCAEVGPLLDADTLSRPLLELARGRNETVAREALQALSAILQGSQVPSLLEIADDRSSDVRDAAATVLQRSSLTSFNNIDDFRSWWKQNANGFDEDAKRDRVESAAKKLSKDDAADRRTLLETIRYAPGGIALVSAAPLLLKADTITAFSADDLNAWNSPLALPFLVERLGRLNTSERRDALNALVKLCSIHPRLRAAYWPLIRSELADEDNSCRRLAQIASSRLIEADGIGPLIDGIQYATGYEAQEASKAFYKLTARTLGFATTEPMPDENAARQRLRGWWESAKKTFVPLNANAAIALPRLWTDMDGAARATKLDALVTAPESRRSAAAFGLAFAERPAGDALWKKLLALGRQRDRAQGILGVTGGDAAAAADLTKRLFSSGDGAEAPLCRALSLLTLATTDAGGKNAGSEKMVEWLRGPGKEMDVAWRRLGIIALGLADRDAASLGYLESVVKAALADKEPSTDTFQAEEPTSDYALMPAAMVALGARSDSSPLLLKILDESGNKHIREWAGRALALRRQDGAVAGVIKALDKADRYDWQDLCRMLDALVKPGDNAAAAPIGALLDSTETASRCAGAFFYSQRPDVGGDADTRGHLVTGLTDRVNLVRYYCAEALGKRRSASSIPRLVELLRDDDDDVRSAAAEALGRIGDKESCALAAEAAEMQLRLDVRWLKAMAIAGRQAHMALLLKLVGSTSYVEQRAGLEAMGFSDFPIALQTLLKTYRNDEAALQTIGAESLAKREDAAVEALQEDLKSSDKGIRGRALHLLSRINTKASRAELEKARNDADPSIKALAEFSLKRLEGK